MNKPLLLTSNFAHLQEHDEQLLRLGMLAEQYFPDDPNTSLLKLQRLAELLAQLVATKGGLYQSPRSPSTTCCAACRIRALFRARSPSSSVKFGAPATPRATPWWATIAPPSPHSRSPGSSGSGSTAPSGAPRSSPAPSSPHKPHRTKAPICTPNSPASARRSNRASPHIRKLPSVWMPPKPCS